MGKDTFYIFLLYVPSQARRYPLGFILSVASKYLKTWSLKALVTLSQRRKRYLFPGETIIYGAAHSVTSQVFLGDFPTIQKPVRSDLARWDELPAQSSVTAAEDGPIHNQAQTDLLATLLQAGYYLQYSYCRLTKMDGTQCLGEEP